MSRDASKKAQERYNEKIVRVHWAINPESDPEIHQAFESLVEKHGGRNAKGSIAAAMREAISKTLTESDSECVDLTRTINVTMSMNTEMLLALNEKATQCGKTLPEFINQALESAIA